MDQAAEIIRELPGHVARVGVFVDADAEMIGEPQKSPGWTRCSFTAASRRNFALSLSSARSRRSEEEPEHFSELPDYDTTLALDSYVKGVPGGTGEKFNWELAVEAKRFEKPILLAGGLTPDNAADAVGRLPRSGWMSPAVWKSPRIKDATKVATLITNAKGPTASDGLDGGFFRLLVTSKYVMGTMFLKNNNRPTAWLFAAVMAAATDRRRN